MRHLFVLGLLAFAMSAAGCSSEAALRTDSSSSAIRAAEEVGAGEVPQASFHLQMAKEELAAAQALSDKGEHDKAVSLLLRAEADAELAVLLSRKSDEKQAALDAMERVHQLRTTGR
jgi:pyridoxal biosynthesis lyase PdxS